MWNSVKQFYKSKEWQHTKQRLFAERMNEEGEWICEHCGKPIDRDELVVHHKTFLTADNVNNLDISLGLENLALLHHTCHNEVHERWGNYNQHIYLVYGAPLSGKTSWVSKRATKDDLIVDIDSIREAISGAKRYERSGYTNSEVFDVYGLLLDKVKYHSSRIKAKNIFVIGGFPHAREREEFCNVSDAEEVFIECSKEECLLRLETKNDGRDVAAWRKYIDDWFFKFNF